MRAATRETHALSSRNLRTLSEKQRVYISCPDLLAEGARFETTDDPETICPDLTVSPLSESVTKIKGR